MRGAVLLCAFGLLGACRAIPDPAPPAETLVTPVPVRFLLTFDDGPSGEDSDNSTARILDTLAHNHWQNDIKAIFFVQTRHPRGGATEIGQALMRRIYREGHLLGLHNASPLGHINHTRISPEELDNDLDRGIEDIRRVTGDVPRFLRPPFWAHNAATVARYEAHGLTMLLDDITIRDGLVRGYTGNPRVRLRIRANLRRSARQIEVGDLPVADGYIPLVMTMHDTNPTTAQHLEDYLGMLIEEARGVGLRVHPEPFVAPMDEVIRVANLRGNRPSYAQRTPGAVY